MFLQDATEPTYLGQVQANQEIAKTLILKSIDKIEQLFSISLSDRVSFQYTVLLKSSTTMVTLRASLLLLLSGFSTISTLYCLGKEFDDISKHPFDSTRVPKRILLF